MLTLDHGKKLIETAREVIKSKLKNKEYYVPSNIKKMFSFRAGCFVTLKLNNELRGCIGYPEPTAALIDALLSSAEKAAFSDPRFPPLDINEYNSISIEISVLTRPRLVMVRNPEDYFKEIQIGVDGLIVKGIWEYGILLPQVPVEYKWDVKKYLEQTCLKAGLQYDAWQDFNKCTIHKFQCQIFSESYPNEVVEIVLKH